MMRRLIKTIIILSVGVLLLTSCGSKNIDIMPYISVEFTGVNTQGKAFSKIDDKGIEKVLLKAAGYKDGGDPFPYLDVLFIVNTEIIPNSELSNGDKITLKINPIQEILDKYKIKLASTEKTFVVSGLKEAQVIDLFSEVELSLEGASPFLKVTAKNRSQDEFLKTVNYTNENDHNIAIGDTVTVKATYSQSAAEQRGCLIETTEKEFTIDNADEYVQKLQDIDPSTVGKILKEATEEMELALSKRAGTIFYQASKNVAFSYGGVGKPTNIIDTPYPTAIYLLSEKNGERLDAYLKGAACIVVLATHGVTKNGDEATIYTMVAIPDIVKKTDGTITSAYADKWLYSDYGLDEETVYSKNIKQYESNFKIDKASITH